VSLSAERLRCLAFIFNNPLITIPKENQIDIWVRASKDNRFCYQDCGRGLP